MLVQKEDSKPIVLAHAYNLSIYKASLGYIVRARFFFLKKKVLSKGQVSRTRIQLYKSRLDMHTPDLSFKTATH